MSFTIGVLVTKNGSSFDGTGVKPDVESLLTPDQEGAFYDLTLENDPQIVKAVEALTNQQTTTNTQGQEGAQSASQPTSETTQTPVSEPTSESAASSESTAASESAA